MKSFNERRYELVKEFIESSEINDPAVLRAMLTVPREEFVDEEFRDVAYEDSALRIGEGQTISQPYVVALMASLLELKSEDKVLEIGTGSGYGAAVLSRIVAKVYTVERYKSLAQRAQKVIESLSYDNVHVRWGDGSLGWAEHAPYDAISVTAASGEVPHALLEQLVIGGRLVMPVGSRWSQELVVVRREGEEKYGYNYTTPVRFVPLVSGEEGE